MARKQPAPPPLADGLIRGDDGVVRCWWGAPSPDYAAYHDHEWGRPMADDTRLLEKLCLEGFQSGLSWLTILRKREAFRAAFAGFVPERVAAFGDADVERLLADRGIVRHRGKIRAAIANAGAACRVIERHGSLAAFVWAFEPPAHERPKRIDRATALGMAVTPASTRFARALKREGFTFVGPTTVQAFMQAMGLVDDHLEGCDAREPVERERAAFVRPTGI
jgi:DNA-3-methyladenine glycosylase I